MYFVFSNTPLLTAALMGHLLQGTKKQPAGTGAAKFLSKTVSKFFALLLACLIILPLFSSSSHARPRYAAIVMDAKTGKVLHSYRADSPRYPASLTKVMTLYLLFEAIEDGRYTLDSKLTVSKYAASKPPSKLWLKPGQTITVKNAIRALVTKSANDVAATVAENLAGSESQFAKIMTAKARALGMRSTRFMNASGLPNRLQKTTARDMLTLGRRVQKDFPQYYHYFSTRRFRYGRRSYGNHNRLLYRYTGTDGIKTGYTRASGFNLISSVRKRGKHVIAVVLGGRTSRWRNARMSYLLNKGFRKARSRRYDIMTAGLAANKKRKRLALLTNKMPRPQLKPETLRTAPEKPQKQPIQIAKATAQKQPSTPTQPAKKSDAMKELVVASLRTPIVEDDYDDYIIKNSPSSSGQSIPVRTVDSVEDLPPLEKASLLGARPLKTTDQSSSTTSDDIDLIGDETKLEQTKPDEEKLVLKGPYHIQIGAYKGKEHTENWLDYVTEEADEILENHRGFVMKVAGKEDLFRARFDGFTKLDAQKTCKVLKEKNIPCLALKAEDDIKS